MKYLYHGSEHHFDHFDISHAGRGEGYGGSDVLTGFHFCTAEQGAIWHGNRRSSRSDRSHYVYHCSLKSGAVILDPSISLDAHDPGLLPFINALPASIDRSKPAWLLDVHHVNLAAAQSAAVASGISLNELLRRAGVDGLRNFEGVYTEPQYVETIFILNTDCITITKVDAYRAGAKLRPTPTA